VIYLVISVIVICVILAVDKINQHRQNHEALERVVYRECPSWRSSPLPKFRVKPPLPELRLIKTLRLDKDDVQYISNLTPLLGLTGLEALDLDGYDCADLMPLAGLTALKRLKLPWRRDYHADDLMPLAGLKKLEVLHIQWRRHHQPGDLMPLVGLKNLEALHIQSGDFSPLEDMNQLKVFSCAVEVSDQDLRHVSRLKNLEKLCFHNNKFTDLTPLLGLKKLTLLELKNSQALTDKEVGKLKKALPNCKIKYTVRDW
jgi:Leucine-rich repeat (LRR) protein